MAPVTRETHSGLRFYLGRVPVEVRPSFFAVATLFALTYRDRWQLSLLWSAVLFGSVLIHELGHAAMMRALGVKQPSIEIGGFGGLAHWNEAAEIGPRGRVLVALAGPGVELLAAGALFALGLGLGYRVEALASAALFGPMLGTDLGSAALSIGLRSNVGWALINLLPIRPLDGSSVVEAVLEGRVDAVRLSRWLTVALGGAMTVYWALGQQFFPALFLGSAAIRAWGELRGAPAARFQTDAPWLEGSASSAEATSAPAEEPPPDSAEVARLEEALRQRPGPETAVAVAWAVLRRDGYEGLREWLTEGAGRGLDGSSFCVIVAGVHHAGEFDRAGELGELLYQRHGNPRDAFNVACSLARAGRHDEAMRWLETARPYLTRDPDALDSDDDLVGLRGHPAFEALRASAPGSR